MSSRRRKGKKNQNDPELTQNASATAQDTEDTAAENADAAAEIAVTEQDTAAQPAPQSGDAESSTAGKAKVVRVSVPTKIRPKKDKKGKTIETDPYGNPIPDKKREENPGRSEPVRTVTPADIKKPQVSFMNSIAHVEPESLSHRTNNVAATAQAYDHAVLVSEDEEQTAYSPKIRRMSDSTRAKELRKRRSTGEKMPYSKDTPVSTPQTLPAAKLRKKKDDSISPEVLERIPEQLKEHPLDEPEKIEYVGHAERTQIDLSADNRPDDNDINIDIRYQNERRARTDLPKELKDYAKSEASGTILNDLLDLKMNLTVRIAVLGLITFLSCVLTLLDWAPHIPMPSMFSSTESPVAFVTVQLLLGLAALPFTGNLLKNGYMKLLQFRADSDSLAAMSMMSAEIAAFLALPSPEMVRSGIVSIYIPIGLLSLLLNAVGKRLIAARAIRNYERLSDGNPKYGIHYVEDEKRAENLTRGTTGDFPILATMQPVEKPEDFLKYTFSTDLADSFCRTAVPLVFFVALAFSVGLTFMRSSEIESAVCFGTSLFALCFAAGACTALTLVSNLPMASGTKDYVRNSGLLLGYQSVDDFYDVNTVMVDATTLFPRGSTTLESIQVIGESRIEEALQYAASLTQHGRSILKDLFSASILAEDKMLLPVENYAYDEGKGISGWINNKRVLLGTRDMMIEHSIEGIPSAAKVHTLMHNGSEALYMSVAGSVSALYMIRLEGSKSIRHWMREIAREKLFLLVRSNDAMLSQRRISKMFGISEDYLKVIPARLEPDYAAETMPLKTAKPSMICAGRLAGFIQTIIGARRIRKAATLGLMLQTVTAVLGLLYVILFGVLGSYKETGCAILLIYHGICTLLTLLAVRMKDT